MKWYQEKFRHSLCDMHIDDWDESFLSEFDPEQYCKNLVTAHVNAPMLYLQSHVGHCYWPTATGHVHHAFKARPDAMRRLVELCHGQNMAVTGYYSLIYNTYEHDRHPDWRLVGADGKTQRERGGRYGHCCPNNPDYRAFVQAQIAEMAEYFRVEGMFYDMPFFPETCCCPSCQKRWATEVGGELPTKPDPKDERWRLRMAKSAEWMGEFCQWVRAETLTAMPWVQSVEFNFACSMISDGWHLGTCEEVGDACDFANGDLYGGIRLQSAACKVYDAFGRERPFEYMTSRCNPNLTKHTISRSPDQLALQTLLTTAHHGATMLIDAIDPVGTQDERAYRRMGEAFAASEPYEPYFTGDLCADAGVLYLMTDKSDRQGRGVTGCGAAIRALTALTSLHIPCAAVTRRQMDDLARYPVILAPLVDTLRPEEESALLEYVRSGGCLYFSGDQPALLKALLHAECIGYTRPTRTYLAPVPGQEALFDGYTAKYPLPVDLALPMVEGVNPRDVLATVTLPYTARDERRFASIHSDPPGVPTQWPAVVSREYGAGRVIWSAAPIENETIADYRRVLRSLLDRLLPAPWLTTDAPERVELIVHRDGDALRIGAVQLTEDDRIDPVYPFTVRVRTDRACSVRLLPDGSAVASEYADGWTAFSVDRLRLYSLYELV